MNRPLCPNCESDAIKAGQDPYGLWHADCVDCRDSSRRGIVGHGATEAEALEDWSHEALAESGCAGCGTDTAELVLVDVRGWAWCQACLDGGKEHPWDAESWCVEHGKRKDLEPCPRCVAESGRAA